MESVEFGRMMTAQPKKAFGKNAEPGDFISERFLSTAPEKKYNREEKNQKDNPSASYEYDCVHNVGALFQLIESLRGWGFT